MRHWLLKTEPDTFSWTLQVAQGASGGIWDGVRNHQAARHLREMATGDQAFFYHTGRDRSVVGIVEIIQAAFPDPTDPEGRFVAVRTRALRSLPRPVSLAEIRRTAGLENFALVRQPRLSVMPVRDAEWQIVLTLAERG